MHKKALKEHIGNSFAVDEKGSVYMVTDGALYRLEAHKGKVKVAVAPRLRQHRHQKPGQTQAGSGTTPTLMAGGRLVAITDNADPMHVLAFRRAVHPSKSRLVCKRKLFDKGAGLDRPEPDRRRAGR